MSNGGRMNPAEKDPEEVLGREFSPHAARSGSGSCSEFPLS